MSFQEVIGHATAIKILQNSLKEKRAGLSYLFYGPDGLGKAFVARQFAKGLNCQSQGVDCCDSCVPCLKADKLEYPDLYWLGPSFKGSPAGLGPEEGSQSIKIEQIRFLQGAINLKPFEGRVKVFVINNCQGLTEEAANCLLKVIEEPPFDSVVILITSSLRSVLPTIASRCQKIKFSNLARAEVRAALERVHNLDSQQSRYLSFYLDARIGDALSLSRSDFFAQRALILDKFLHSQTQSSGKDLPPHPASSQKDCINLAGCGGLFKDKAKTTQALSILISWFRDLLFVKLDLGSEYLINQDRLSEIAQEAPLYSYAQLLAVLNCLAKSFEHLKQNVNVRLIADNLWANLT